MSTRRRWIACWLGVTAAAIVGGALVIQTALASSATYDEVAYLEIAARWWRTGDTERITRMGSPLTFWKLQQAPALWAADRAGRGDWIDDPIGHQSRWLPWVRAASAWMWLAALLLTAGWAAQEHGPGAAALAAWLFALSPNLIAHGALATMEMPLVTTTALVFLLFARFLRTGDRRCFWGSAVACGLAFSCKFSAVLLPVLLGFGWTIERASRRPAAGTASSVNPLPDPAGAGRRRLGRGIGAMIGFLLVMAGTNLVVTGGAMLPPSQNLGAHPSLGRLGPLLGPLYETPAPQDWVAFARQMQHQRGGGPGYLLGERRMTGWWSYYLICLAVKVPLSLGLLVLARCVLVKARPLTSGDRLAAAAIVATLAIVSVGSSRNYGFRYILFLAPAALVGIAGLAAAGRWGWRVALVGLVGQGIAVASIHPHALSYFNRLAGGPEGGRWILADSNLDWGQGARALARLQRLRPELRELTFYAFGDTDPAHYGVAGRIHRFDAHGPVGEVPPRLRAATPFVAVSRSLQHGPWGPPGYFRALEGMRPSAITDDHTIAVYRMPIPGN